MTRHSRRFHFSPVSIDSENQALATSRICQPAWEFPLKTIAYIAGECLTVQPAIGELPFRMELVPTGLILQR